jgi:hypothetical protein
VAGYKYEGAHSIYWLVHPFCPVLAHSVAGRNTSAPRMAAISAIPPDWHHGGRCVRIDLCLIVPSRAITCLEENLNATYWKIME